MLGGMVDEEPPADWPTPMDAITPRSLAEIESDVAILECQVDEIERRSAVMVEGMRQHFRGWGGPQVPSSGGFLEVSLPSIACLTSTADEASDAASKPTSTVDPASRSPRG